MINTAPLNFYFILHHHFRFCKDFFFFFLNVYISMNTIFECSYLFFGWEVGHPLGTQKQLREWRRLIQNVCRCVQGRVVWHLMCAYWLLCCCLMVSRFICKNLTLPSFKKDLFVRNILFSPMRSISVVWNKFFYSQLFFKTKVSQSIFNF